MNRRILLVDDDPNVLQGYMRHLRRYYDLSLATSANQAMQILEDEPTFAVVVSDMQMPDISGIEFLAQVREKHEQTVRMMLTGNADQQTAVEAVNEGNIFRFLNKPCPADSLSAVLDQGIEHHRLVTAEAELLSKTLSGSVRMLTQVLSLAMPDAFGLTQEARMLVRRTVEHRNAEMTSANQTVRLDYPMWQVELAAMLMRLGMVSISPELRERYLGNESLTKDEQSQIHESAKLGAELVAAIPRLQGVAELIGAQYIVVAKKDDSTASSGPVLANLLRVVADFQRKRGTGAPLAALSEMDNSEKYDPRWGESLTSVVRDLYRSAQVSINELTEGMLLDADIVDVSGRLLVARGTEVHDSLVQKLMSIRRSGTEIEEPIEVRVMELKSASQDAALDSRKNPITSSPKPDPSASNLSTAGSVAE